MRHCVARFFVAFAIVGLGSFARAFAEEPAEEPAARTEKLRAAFPAPSAAHAFHATYDALQGAERVGSWEMSAEPVTEKGETLWRLRERMLQTGGVERSAECFAGSDLSGRRGTFSRGTGDDVERGQWTHVAGKIIVLRRSSPGSAEGSNAEVAEIGEHDALPAPLSGFAAVLLFCRLVPDVPAKYDVLVHDAIGDRIDTMTLDVRGPAMWTAGTERFRVWLVVATVQGRAVRLGFSFPGRGEFVGLDAQGAGLSFVRQVPKDGATMPNLSLPAATPEAAAAKHVVALATGDADLLRAVFHWPTMHETAKRRDPNATEALEAFVEQSVAAIRASVRSPKPRADVEAAVAAGLAHKSVVTKPDRPDRAEVTLHVGGATQVMHVRRIDDVWYVVPKE